MQHINSLAPGRCGSKFTSALFKLILQIDILSTSCEIGFRRVPQYTSDDEPTLVQVTAWCRQATSNYLGQYGPRPMPAYGTVTRPQVATFTNMV